MQHLTTADHAVIHAFSLTAAGVGAGLAQIPGADAPVLVGLQATMLTQIAMHHGRSLTEAAATEMVFTLAATMAGRTASQWLVGWIPGWGNAINASTAAALTETLGWLSVAWFERDA